MMKSEGRMVEKWSTFLTKGLEFFKQICGRPDLAMVYGD